MYNLNFHAIKCWGIKIHSLQYFNTIIETKQNVKTAVHSDSPIKSMAPYVLLINDKRGTRSLRVEIEARHPTWWDSSRTTQRGANARSPYNTFWHQAFSSQRSSPSDILYWKSSHLQRGLQASGGGGEEGVTTSLTFECRYPKQNYRPTVLCYHCPLSMSLTSTAPEVYFCSEYPKPG